jgi:hypothetical protein
MRQSARTPCARFAAAAHWSRPANFAVHFAIATIDSQNNTRVSTITIDII